jgi:hypothetical protein
MNIPRPHMAVQLLLVSGELRLSSMLSYIHYVLATQALTDLLDVSLLSVVNTSNSRGTSNALVFWDAPALSPHIIASCYQCSDSTLPRCNLALLVGAAKPRLVMFAIQLSLSFPQRSCALVRPGRTLFQKLPPGSRFCELCTVRSVAQWDSDITLVWNKLPSYFELPPWWELPSEDAHTS